MKKIPDGVVPHHSFHVFFVGSITGRVRVTLKLKDECRVSWGTVKKIFSGEGQVLVRANKLFPNKTAGEIKVALDKFLTPKLKEGDYVSFHWSRISEKLSLRSMNDLKFYTMINYKKYIKQYG